MPFCVRVRPRGAPAAMKQFDFIVLGSGIVGLSFAHKVAPREVEQPFPKLTPADTLHP